MDLDQDILDGPAILSSLEALATLLDALIERGINLKDKVEDMGVIIAEACELTDFDVSDSDP